MDFFTSKAACRVFQKSAAKWCRTKRSNKKLLICCSSQAETNVRSPLSACRMKQKVKHSCCSAQSISTLLICAKKLQDAGVPNLWIPKQVHRVEAIPVLASGKLDLKKCNEVAAK